jgi:hypothetical protein
MRFLFVLLALLIPTLGFAAEKRVALVIGNSSYANSPLKNPVNDAKDMATKLRGLGFEVIERNNLTTRQIGGTLREFRSKLAPGAVALVFYAGHGLQIKGDNYLPAVDADINSEEDVPNQSIAMKQIMDVLDESKSRLNLVFLDACRNNPYARSFRSSDRGLARVNAPSGTLISYATKPGSVAADGTGRNGLYTSKLLAQMESNQQIEQSLKRVVTEVKAASNGKQEPWMEGSIEGDFCFGGCTSGDKPSLPIKAASPIFDSETEVWGIVKETTDVEVVRDFLKEFPKGKYATSARFKLKELENKTKVAMAPRPQTEPNKTVVPVAGLKFERDGFRFYNNEDVVVDTRTGLMWARNGNIAGKKMNWNDAMAWVKTLEIGGYRDWRLPTKEELDSFAKLGGNLYSKWFNANGFSNVQSFAYWSGTTMANFSGGAWNVSMYDGLVGDGGKLANAYVWPVHSGQ